MIRQRLLQPRRALLLVLYGLISPLGTVRVLAAGPIFEPPELQILLAAEDPDPDGKPGKKPESSERADLWKKACQNLGRALGVGSGPWGFGFFARHSCAADTGANSKVIGPGKAPVAQAPVATSPWTLEIAGKGNQYEIRVSNGDGRLESEVKFSVDEPMESPELLLEFLQSLEFVDLVAMRILTDLPAAGVVSQKALSKTGTFVGRFPYRKKKSRRQFDLVAPPASLIAFQLRTAPKSVFQVQAGSAIRRLGGGSGGNDWDPARIEKKRLDSAAKVRWRLDAEDAGLVRDGKYVWFQNPDGRGVQNSELDSAINGAMEKLTKARKMGLLGKFVAGLTDVVLDSAAAGYAGFRFGRQTLSGSDPLLKNLRLIGVVAEVRGGPLAGLRFYYDRVLDQEVEQYGIKSSLGWSRLILGKSFGLDTGGWVDRVDLTPKVGIWNFNSLLVDGSTDPANPIGLQFELDGAPSFAIEAGVEWTAKSYVVRLWYGLDGAALVSQVAKNSVSSNRAGVDVVLSGGPDIKFFGTNFNPAWIAFYTLESLALSGTGTEINQAGVGGGRV